MTPTRMLESQTSLFAKIRDGNPRLCFTRQGKITLLSSGMGGRGVAVVWLYDRTTRRGVPEKKRKVKGENITLLSTLEFCNQWIELSGSELYTMSLYVFSGVCR